MSKYEKGFTTFMMLWPFDWSHLDRSLPCFKG